MTQPPPPHSLKVKHVFDLCAVNKRNVSLEDFCKGFQQLSLDLSPIAVADLHGKSDTNGDGALSYNEWQRMAEMYPTLMDCLYYRAVDQAASDERERELAELQQLIQDLRKKQSASQGTVLEAEKATREAEAALEGQLQRLEEHQKKENAARQGIEEARQATEQARASIRDALGELNAAKDAERQANATAQEAAHQVETASRRLQIQANKVAQAEEVLRELELQLKEAKRAVEIEMHQLDSLNEELSDAGDREQESRQLHQEAARALQETNDKMQSIENGIKDRQAKEKELATQLRELVGETGKGAAAKADAERNLAAAKEAEKQKKQDVDGLTGNIAKEEQRLADLAKEHQEILSRRELTSAEEQPLIEQELALRKQREVLEHKEARLNGEVTAFVDKTQRSASPVRGGGRSQSPRNSRAGGPHSPMSSRGPSSPQHMSPPRPKLR